jgi:hypothetical protein
MSKYFTEYDAIVETVQRYIDGCKKGESALMRPAFHPEASFFGYAGGELVTGTAFLFDYIDKNGPAPDVQPRFAAVDIVESIATVRLEVESFSGALAGSGVHMSDFFTLIKTPEGWRITQKSFHWH